MEKRMMRGLIFSVLSAISLIGSDVQDLQSLKSGATPACCSKLVTGQVWQDGMAVPTTSTGSMSQTGTLTWSGGTTTQGTGGVSFNTAGDYFKDISSSNTGLYGATTGSGTWTVPTGVTKLIIVTVGGGGSGSSYFYDGTNGGKTCFGSVCANGGEKGYKTQSGHRGGNGGSGGGGCGGTGTWKHGGGGGGGGGLGGTGGATANVMTMQGDLHSGAGGTRGTDGGAGISGCAGGIGQGTYTTTITTQLSGKMLTNNTSVIFPFTNGAGSGTYSYGGTGYGGGGGGNPGSYGDEQSGSGGGSGYVTGASMTVTAGQTFSWYVGAGGSGLGGYAGGNGAIFVWTE